MRKPQHGNRRRLDCGRACRLALVAFSLMALAGPTASRASESYTTLELMEGFMRTVFGIEHAETARQQMIVKKFHKPVRFFILDMGSSSRRSDVEKFVLDLPKKIDGIETEIVTKMHEANFRIFVVNRSDYSGVVRNWVYRNPLIRARGLCLVRIQADKRGIDVSDAVIVSDEGNELFERCLVEEVLQGLGPMNDDSRLVHSVFNDSSKISTFGRFDRFLLNMLYDRRVRAGMTESEVSLLLPTVIRDLRARLD